MGVSSAAAVGSPWVAGASPPVKADFERVFDGCATGLYRYFLVRTRDSHLADDLMQQLWMQASRGASSVAADKLEPWLRTVARNLLRTHWRRVQVRDGQRTLADPGLAAELADRMTCEDIPAREFERREVRDQLMLAITELDAADQELILGFYFDGLSQTVLAERAGLSERAIEGRLYRARQALRDKLRHLEPEE